jgi:hypothetical protein
MIEVKEPLVLSKVFNDQEFSELKSLFPEERVKSFEFDAGFSRYLASDDAVIELKDYSEKLIPIVRELTGSNTMMPTYTLFAHYEGPNAHLVHHKDDNACTYTVDMCVYQKEPWDLWVENKPYTLYPNQAAAFYGNDQEHWREEFPNKDTNHVAMVFFHFAEADHWWFTKGRNYLDVIRGVITEEEWNKRNGHI